MDKCHMQMERWDGTVLDINQTCTKLGSKCLQLLGMHALTGCDTTSFPFNKGKVSALSVLEAGDFPGLFNVLGEEDAMRWDLLDVGLSFFCALFGQKPGTPMEDARYNLYTKTKARPRLRNLPPNSANLLLHVQRAHLQMTLWKAADKHSPPDIYIYQQLRMGDEGWRPITVYRSRSDRASRSHGRDQLPLSCCMESMCSDLQL